MVVLVVEVVVDVVVVLVDDVVVVVVGICVVVVVVLVVDVVVGIAVVVVDVVVELVDVVVVDVVVVQSKQLLDINVIVPGLGPKVETDPVLEQISVVSPLNNSIATFKSEPQIPELKLE